MKQQYRPNDPLSYLPRRPLVAYSKGEVIYAGKCEFLYLVATSRIKVSSIACDGYEAVVKIVPAEGLFGESCLVTHEVEERAQALDRVQIMSWRRDEIEQQIDKMPRLGLALMEELVVSACQRRDKTTAFPPVL